MAFQNILDISDESTPITAAQLKLLLLPLLAPFNRPPAFATDFYHAGYGPWSTAGSAFAPSVDNIRLHPFYSMVGGRIDRIAFNVTITGGAGSLTRVGIYESDPLTRLPNRLAFDSGSVDTNTTGFLTTAIDTVLRPATLYYFAMLTGVAAPTVSAHANSGAGALFGWTAANPPVKITSLLFAQAFAALPATLALASGNLSTTQLPWIGVRYAA